MARSSTKSGARVPFVIQIRGELNGRWSEWFNVVKITVERTDDRPPLTTMHCPAMDQAKLRGVINKIWDMNLTLVSVRQMSGSASFVQSVEAIHVPDKVE